MCAQKNIDRNTPVSPVRLRKRFAHDVLHTAGQQGGLTLLIEGLAGMGKTYMLRELIDAAVAAKTWEVHVVRADEIESGEPYSFIERFVAVSGMLDWRFTPTAQTSAIDVARECVERLVGETESPRRLIVIDDAQWVDADSQRVLRYLIPRVTRRRTLFACGVRTPNEPGSFGEFLRELVTESPFDAHFTVEPLTAHEISSLVVDRHGVGMSNQIAQQMKVETGGSFLEVDSLLASLTPDEISQLHVAWAAPTRGKNHGEVLLHQFRKLSDTAAATAEVVCLAGHEVTHEELTETSRLLAQPVVLDEAISAGVLNKSEFNSGITARHALLAQAIRESVPAERARQILQALSQVTSGFRSLLHTLLSSTKWTDDLHQQVNAYALEAAAAGKYNSATEILRAALDIASAADARENLLESLALIHLQAKTSYEMLDLTEEAEKLTPSILHELIAITLAAHNVRQELPKDRMQKLLQARPTDANDAAILAFYNFLFVILTMRSPNLEQVPALIGLAKMMVQNAPSNPADVTDPRLKWMVAHDEYLLVLDSYLMVQDQMKADMERVRAGLPDLVNRIDNLADGPYKVDALVAIAGGELAVGNVGDGFKHAKQSIELLGRVSEPWAASTARLIYADSLVLQGQYAEAVELMELAEEVTYSSLDVETRSEWAAMRVTIASITGAEFAEGYLEQARHQLQIPWEGYGPDMVLIAECEHGRTTGDTASILHATGRPWAHNLVNTRRGFLTYRVHALIDSEDLDAAAELVDQLSAWRGDRWQEYWGSLDWLRARLAQAQGDIETAQWHYESAAEQRDFPLPLGLTLTDFGEFLLQTGHADEAARVLGSAAEILEGIGAEGYLPRVQKLLRPAAVAAPGPVREHVLEVLTERERQIALHLAKGRSNNQIAESLVVSVATVRSHVSNVLRKLQVSSRGEVAKLLREEPVEAS